jgi:nucleoid-associated protein YgaU
MYFSRSPLYFVSALALALSVSACSSAPPEGEASTAEDGLPSPESSADQVGSIPEDMLADEKGPEGTEASADGSTESAEADPFSDLKAEDEAADAATPGAQEETTAEAETTLPSERDALVVPEEEKSEPAGSGQMERYTVKSGDTLMKIAFHIYGDVDRWKELQELNEGVLKGKHVLRKGMQLRYEAPLEPFNANEHAKAYEIKKGDTLAGIADEVYGRSAKYKKLQGYNRQLIKNPNRIFAGFTIYYDITQQEIAEAEARRAQRLAKSGGGGSAPAPAPMPASPPSAIAPPPEAAPAPKNMATDNSAVQGPTSAPAPTAQ